MRTRPVKQTDLNRRLIQVRENWKMTQEEFGSQIGASARSVSRWEQGAADVPLYVIIAIEHIFGVSRTWIATGEGPMMIVKKPLPTKADMDAADISFWERSWCHPRVRQFLSGLVPSLRGVAGLKVPQAR